MANETRIDEADLCALREFLVRHFADNDPKFAQASGVGIAEMFYAGRYLFSYVNADNEGAEFLLRRVRGFIDYDLAKFAYSEGAIQVQREEIRDASDAEKVEKVAEVLGARCYRDLISNLEELRE